MPDRLDTAPPRGTAGADAGPSPEGHAGDGPGLLHAWLRGPVRDTAWISLGAVLAVAALLAALTVVQPAGTVLTPRNEVPPAAAPGAVPPVPELPEAYR